MNPMQKKLKRVERTYLAFTRAAESLLLSVHEHVTPVHVELPNVEIVQNLVCAHFGVSPAVLLSFCRLQSYVTARHAAMWLARQTTQHTLEEIAQAFNGRDHGTVSWACNSVVNRMTIDLIFRKEMEALHAQALTALQRTSSHIFHQPLKASGR